MSSSPTIVKRSVKVAGHSTSVSLEDEFWIELKLIADDRGISVAALISEIDQDRKTANLSSALRLSVLRALKQKLAGRK